jgi:hypothetical protein
VSNKKHTEVRRATPRETLFVWRDNAQKTASELYYAPGARVSVHTYMGYPPDTFFVTCFPLGVERVELRAKTLDEAKKEGLQRMAAHVCNAHEALLQAIATIAATEPT